MTRTLALLALVTLAGCQPSWHTVAIPAPDRSGWHAEADSIEVIDGRGERKVGRTAVLLRDTLWVAGDSGYYRGTALREVTAVRKWTDRRGALAPVGVVGVIVLVVMVAALEKGMEDIVTLHF